MKIFYLMTLCLGILSCKTFFQGSKPSIYGGTNTSADEWTSTVGLTLKSGIFCTGVLIQPQIVLTAAHCLEDPLTGTLPSDRIRDGLKIYVGNGINGGHIEGQYEPTEAYINPLYHTDKILGNHDLGVVILKQPIINILPTLPVIDVGELREVFNKNKPVTLVGYGQTESNGFGIKKQVVVNINKTGAIEFTAGGNGKDTCQGDSGGPVYTQLNNGDFRVLGLTSRGDTGSSCGDQGIYTLIMDSICWINGVSHNSFAKALPTFCTDVPHMYSQNEVDALRFDFICQNPSTTQEDTLKALKSALSLPQQTNCTELSTALQNARVLDLNFSYLVDISPLIGATNLEELYLEQNKIRSIIPITRLKQLRILNITLNDIQDMTSLSAITNPNLKIDGQNRQMQDLINTTFLKLCKNSNITSSQGDTIAAMKDILKKSNCEDANQELLSRASLEFRDGNIEDLSPLSDLLNIKTLTIYSNKLTDISPLATIQNLKELNIPWTLVEDVSPLNQLVAKNGLQINGLSLKEKFHKDTVYYKKCINSKTKAEANMIFALEKYTLDKFGGLCKRNNIILMQQTEMILSLQSMNDYDLNILSDFTNLKRLTLDRGGITSLNGIERLVNLEFLSIKYNQIVDVTPLASLSNLKELNISYNHIKDFSPLQPIINRGLVVTGMDKQK